MKRPSTARLRELQQLRVLAHPLRLQLLELFAAAPRTTKQAAELLGESPTRLYHHVHALERAALVRLTSRRQVRGTVEKYYQATARRFEVDRGMLAGQRGARAVATSMFDLRGELSAALAARARAGGREPLAARTTLLLDDEQARALRSELIARVERIHAAQGAARSPGRRAWNLTIALLPASPARAGRRPRRA